MNSAIQWLRRKRQKTSIPQISTTLLSPQLTYGLTDRIDIQYDAFYVQNKSRGKTGTNLGDTPILIGYQLLTQNKNGTTPDIRLTVQEVFPTGHYDRLKSNNFGVGISGTGSFITSIDLNTEYLSAIGTQHYLKTHACLSYTYAHTVALNGLSTYGGSVLTQGHINPGNGFSIDLAAEFTLTQNWVAVIEGFFSYQQASKFHGIFGDETYVAPVMIDTNQRIIPTKHNIGGENNNFIGNGTQDAFSLAPALEYNFSNHLGLIGGVWFIVAGKNTPSFVGPMLSLVTTC